MNRRALGLSALVAALVLAGWSGHAEYTEEAPTRTVDTVDVRVPAGEWHAVTSRADEPAQKVRVLSVIRTSALHPESGDEPETLPAPGEFAVVTVECECPDPEEFDNPVEGLVDDRGRVWEEADSLFDDYLERGPGVVRAGDIDEEPKGPVRYAVYFPVAADARGLVVTAQDRGGEKVSAVGWTGAER